jgi:uncharacterized membrane protein
VGVLTPPYGSPDEQVHLARALLISEGRWWAPGEAEWARADIPRSLVRLYRQMDHAPATSPPRRFRAAEIIGRLRDPLDPAERVEARYLGYYPPLAYAPQAAALWLARRFESSPAVLLYAGRLGNLLFYAALGVLALRLAPRRGWALCLLLLLPMNVAQAASLSADAPTLAVAVLLFALACRAALGPEPPGPRARRGLLATSGALGLVKPGYGVLALLPLLVPPDRFARRATWRRLCGGSLLFAAVPSVLWMAIVAASGPFSPSPQADARAQLTFVLSHPGAFAAAVARTLALGLPTYAETFVGRLGHLNVALPAWVWIGALLALAASALADPPDPPALDGRRRGALVALFALGAAGLFVLAYLGWNAVGSRLIQGVQGRYFAPFAPLLLLAIPARGGGVSEAARAGLVAAAGGAGLAATAAALARAFFTAG